MSHPPYTVAHTTQDIVCCTYITICVVCALFTVCHHKLVRELLIFLWFFLLTHCWELKWSQALMDLSLLWAELLSVLQRAKQRSSQEATVIFAHGQAELQVRAQGETSFCEAQQKCMHFYPSCPALCSFSFGKHFVVSPSKTQKINLPRNCNSIIFISGFDTLINMGKLNLKNYALQFMVQRTFS